MPRQFKRKTNRVFPEGDLRRAVEKVLNNQKSLREAASLHNVTKSRLGLYVKKAKEVGLENVSFNPNFKSRQVFTDEMEKALEKYLLRCQKMFYGVTPKKARQLAYQYAEHNSLKYPESWKEKHQAGEDWFSGFMKRHSNLSIRKPEATSLARMTAFNRTTVKEFFDNLENIKLRKKFQAADIFNLDETGVTTVPAVEKVIGQKGEKQVSY